MKIKKEELKFRKAVFIVVYRKNQETKQIEYLILKRKKHWIGWEFPKGGIDKGEKLIETAKRETYEESGLKPLKIKKYPISGKYRYSRIFSDRPNIIGQTYTLFSAEVKNNKKIKLDTREHSGYVWLSFNKAIKKLKFNNQIKCLKIVNRGLVG